MLKGGVVAQTPWTDIETGTQVQIRAFVSFCTLISALIAIHVVIEEKGWNTFIPTFNRHFIQSCAYSLPHEGYSDSAFGG